MRRIALFIGTNLAVLLLLSIVAHLFGIDRIIAQGEEIRIGLQLAQEDLAQLLGASRQREKRATMIEANRPNTTCSTITTTK